MGHRKHYHDSHKHSKVTCPVPHVLRSKSYPREERLKSDHCSRNDTITHTDHQHVSKSECHRRKDHKDQKKQDKTEKNKYNIEKYLKEKDTKKSHHHHHHHHFKHFDSEDKSTHHKRKGKLHKSFQDLMKLDYCVTPVHVVTEKKKYRSKSGEEKRPVSLHKNHSRSQDDYEHKKGRKHSQKELVTESSPPSRSHQRKTSNRKHTLNYKHFWKPEARQSTEAEALCSGLYKFFRLEKSEICDKDSGEIDQVKHFVSPDNSEEIAPVKKHVSRHKRKANPKEPTKKKTDDEMKKYFLKIQQMIDEKLNFFLHKTLSNQISAPELKNERLQKKERHKNKKPNLEIIQIDVKPKDVEGLEIKAVERQFTDDENNKQPHISRRKTSLRTLKSNHSPQNNTSRHSSLQRDAKTDNAPTKSKTSVISERQRLSTPKKKYRTLKCKTVSIVSIIPQKHTEKVRNSPVISTGITEETVERKKKSKCFKRYYNYEHIDANSNSSEDKSVMSDSFKNFTEFSDKNINQKQFEKKEPRRFSKLESKRTKFFDTNQDKLSNLPPYWNDKCQQFWRPQGIVYVSEKENLSNYTETGNLKRNHRLLDENFTPIYRSRIQNNFIQLYSNENTKFGESSLDSLLSKSSIQPYEKKFTVRSTQTTGDEFTYALKKYPQEPHKSKSIEYVEYANKNPTTESLVDNLVNKPFPINTQTKRMLPLEHQNAAFVLPENLMSKALENLSTKRTNDIGIGKSCVTEDIVSNQQQRSHISIQADLMPYNSTTKLNDNLKVANHNRADIGTQASITGPKKINIVKDQISQVSRDLSENERDNKMSIGIDVSKKSLGISTSLPFLGEPRKTNLRPKTSGSLKGTIETLDSTVASLICVHRFHGDKISSSNKSNNQSLNEFYIKPLGTSHRRSTLFLTKGYKPADQSSYQKRKMYDEKIRKKIKRKNQNEKDVTPQIFEVRFVTVENTSSQNNEVSCTRNYVNPNFNEKKINENVFSYALQQVDKFRKNKDSRIDEGATSEPAHPAKMEGVPHLQGIIDCICKSLVTYYHNANFCESPTDIRVNKKTVEALYECDHFHKNSSSSYSLSETDSRSSGTDSRFTKCFRKTSTSSGKCFCFDNSCPTSNSADSFFDYPYSGGRYVNPTILGYALDNKMRPPEPCKKEQSLNDVSLSEESGYGTDEKTEMSINFFKRPAIAALLEPHQKIFTDIYFCQAETFQSNYKDQFGQADVGEEKATNINSKQSLCDLTNKQSSTSFDCLLECSEARQWSEESSSNYITAANWTESHSNQSSSTLADRQWSRNFDLYSQEPLDKIDVMCSQDEHVSKTPSSRMDCEDALRVNKCTENSGVPETHSYFKATPTEELFHNQSSKSLQERYCTEKLLIEDTSYVPKEFCWNVEDCSRIEDQIFANHPCWKSTKDDKLFDIIENDLREIYDPSEKRTETLKCRIQKKCNSIFKILTPRRMFKKLNNSTNVNNIAHDIHGRPCQKSFEHGEIVVFQVIVLSYVIVLAMKLCNLYVLNLY